VATLDVSGADALNTIQNDPRWVAGQAAYAEAHCFSSGLGIWCNGVVTPMPDEPLALVEVAQSTPEGGFWVHVFTFKDVPN
jgi:hypothetical protein